MATRFALPFADVGSGIKIASGSKLFFFESNTSDPKDTFSDAGAASPNTNPVVANSDGVFPDIFISGSYKVVLDNGVGVQQWEADPVVSFSGSTDITKTFDTVAQMKADASVSIGQYVQTAEHTAGAGFEGGNTYLVRAVTAAADDNGSVIKSTGNTAVEFAGIFSLGVNILQFGAAPESPSLTALSFSSCISYVGLAGGGEISLPSATLQVDAAIVVNQHNIKIKGQGSASRIETTSQSANIFEVNKGGQEIRNAIFEDFSVWSTVVKTSGSAFACEKAARCSWGRVFIAPPENVVGASNRLYSGIDLDEFDYCNVSDCSIITTFEGIACNGGVGSVFGAGLWVNDGTKIQGQSTGAGIHIGGGAGGVYINDSDIIDNLVNVRISVSRQPGTPNREVFMGATCSLDSAHSVGVIVEPNSLTHLDMTGTWVASAGAVFTDRVGIEIQSPNPTLKTKINGCRVFSNKGGGISLDAGDNVITGCFIIQNGDGDVAASSGGHGIRVSSALATSTNITGNWIVANGNGTTGDGFGVTIITTAPNFNISSNTFGSNVQGPVFFPGTYNQSKISNDNTGFASSTSGFASITAGNSTVVVNHGMGAGLPVAVFTQPTGNFPETGQSYLQSVGTTSFTINLGGVATRNNDFYWSARIFGL